MTLTIYQIYCKDENISDCYIGSTVNFSRRKRSHKSDCCNEQRHTYNVPVYKFIRENGGFDNWEFKILNQMEYYPELRFKQEQAYIDLMKPTLNTVNAVLDAEKIKKHKNEYEKNNKEKFAEHKKKYYGENKEKFAEYYRNNKEKISHRNSEYRKNNKDKVNARKRELRAKKKVEGLV